MERFCAECPHIGIIHLGFGGTKLSHEVKGPNRLGVEPATSPWPQRRQHACPCSLGPLSCRVCLAVCTISCRFFCVVLSGCVLPQVVDVRGKGNLDAEAMVFVSGRSGAHLRRMADVIVTAVSTPRLTQSPQSGTPVKPPFHRPRVAVWATSP